MLVALVLVAVRFAFRIFVTKKPRTSNPAEQINKNENSSKDAIICLIYVCFWGDLKTHNGNILQEKCARFARI